MVPRAVKHQLTCPIELTSDSFLIGRRDILVIPRNHLVGQFEFSARETNKSRLKFSTESICMKSIQFFRNVTLAEPVGKYFKLFLKCFSYSRTYVSRSFEKQHLSNVAAASYSRFQYKIKKQPACQSRQVSNDIASLYFYWLKLITVSINKEIRPSVKTLKRIKV